MDTRGGLAPSSRYFLYRYWWDEGGHRHLPFEFSGGYGRVGNPAGSPPFGTVSISPAGSPYRAGSPPARTPSRVTGKCSSRLTGSGDSVTDSPDAPLPFQLRVDVNQNVRIYLNHGFYAKAQPLDRNGRSPTGWICSGRQSPKSCQATLAIVCEGADIQADSKHFLLGATKPGKPSPFMFRPAPRTRTRTRYGGLEKADAAQTSGFKALRSRQRNGGRSFTPTLASACPTPSWPLGTPVPPITSGCSWPHGCAPRM